jgi:HrpA-like RNA helicase
VIVATNVAETSLTIPGVRAVVDAGLARIAGASTRTWRHIEHLAVEPVSQSLRRTACRPRRSHRSGPLLSGRGRQTDHEARPLARSPGVSNRLDLSETILLLLRPPAGWQPRASLGMRSRMTRRCSAR